MYIRFGVHKDRAVLKETRDSFMGIIVPAHILAHSTDATTAAINYINKPFFIDPMTYIFTRGNIKSYVTKDSDDKAKFKMSIEKMADEYGILEHFSQNDYRPLTEEDFNDDFINDFCIKSLEFQKGKVHDQTESAYKKYSKILSELDLSVMQAKDHQPLVYTPPYFYMDKVGGSWHDINIKLAKKTLSLDGMTRDTVAPVILTKAANLTEELLTSYKPFSTVLLWISDLDESSPNESATHIEKLEKYRKFIDLAKKENMKVINLYGSYYSAILTTVGLEAFSNGIFYGEYKSHVSKVGGGGPPIRFYISKLHRFYLVPTTLAILNAAPELFEFEPPETKTLLGNNQNNVAEMLNKKNGAMAQKHFLWARKQELQDLNDRTISDISLDLSNDYNSYGSAVANIHTDAPLHLKAWSSALNNTEPKTNS